MPEPGNLLGSLVFGVIGFGAFMYGRKSNGVRAMGLGVAMMIYPYFVEPTWLLWSIGVALTAALFVWRD